MFLRNLQRRNTKTIQSDILEWHPVYKELESSMYYSLEVQGIFDQVAYMEVTP